MDNFEKFQHKINAMNENELRYFLSYIHGYLSVRHSKTLKEIEKYLDD